jgi:hypothetical protein
MGFKHLADAMVVELMFTFYNMFRGRITRGAFRDMLNQHHQMPHLMFCTMSDTLRKRREDNPWLFYGNQFDRPLPTRYSAE